MAKEQIILLNGASSAGKSTLAVTLQNALDKPYLTLSLDEYSDLCVDYISTYQKIGRSIFPEREVAVKFPQGITGLPGLGMGALSIHMLTGFHRLIAAKAKAGQRVIADHIFEQRRWLEECVKLFEGIEVIFVGVHCSLEELERREKARGDRAINLARRQYRKVHRHGIYDIEIETTSLSPEACATTIIEYIKSGEPPTAFEQLRKKMGNDGRND